jgi:membrane dipeptidase
MVRHKDRCIGRRRLLKLALATTAAGSLGYARAAAPAEPSNTLLRARRLLKTAVAIDMHSHVGGTAPRWLLHDFPDVRAGGLSAVCIATVSDEPVLGHTDKDRVYATREPNPGEFHDFTLERLDFAEHAMREFDMIRIDTADDLRSAKARKKAGLLLATEGGDFLEGRLDGLELLYRRGVRHFQLVHYRADNGLADIQTEAPRYDGATPFALDVVRACNKLGVIVDVAHATLPAVRQIAEVSATPLILSHTQYVDKPGRRSRHINREHAELIRAAGGVVGQWINATDFPDYAAFAESLARLADAIGVDHVGIGSDMHGLFHPLLRAYTRFPELIAPLFDHFSEEEVGKIIGGNYLRVFEAVQCAARH